MVAANDKDLSVCSLNIVISMLLGRVVGNPEVGTWPSSRLLGQVEFRGQLATQAESLGEHHRPRFGASGRLHESCVTKGVLSW
jgi:hypothetical protein